MLPWTNPPVWPALFDGWPVRLYRQRLWRRLPDQVWGTAIHEAGHAVVARLLNVPFTQVTIRPSLGRVLGHVAMDYTDFLNNDAELTRRVTAIALVLVAGEIAMRELAFVRSTSGGSDYEQLHRLLGGDKRLEEEMQTVVRDLEKSVAEFKQNSSAKFMICRLAAVLTKRITLSSTDAVSAMNGDLV